MPDAGAGADRVAVSTARIQELISLAEQRMASEVMRYQQERVRLLKARAARLGPLEAQIERTEQAAQVLVEVEKDDPSRYERVGDERQPESYVRSRRLVAADRHRAEVSERYFEEKRRLGEMRQQVAVVELGLRSLDEVAKMRVRRAFEYGNRRIYGYWAAFVRHHPDSAEVNHLCVPVGPSLRAWADSDEEGHHEKAENPALDAPSRAADPPHWRESDRVHAVQD
ncbi:hypothetical protein [Amycolatopsis nigrescens]|uniref:hypothetical protein n=1 Tax=Amycolatopsis nigrescens TaxID=381445 RepID=UPI0003A92B7B|nr:hypothetical protein [Amycolatopsis nigrescens]